MKSKYIMRAVLEAAWQEKSPVILEVAESETHYCNMMPERLAGFAYPMIDEMIEKYGYSVPVCLHHDHIQKDVDGCIQRSIEAGFSCVVRRSFSSRTFLTGLFELERIPSGHLAKSLNIIL